MEVMRLIHRDVKRMMGRPKRPFNKEDTVLLVLPPARFSINTQKIFLRYNDIPHVNRPTFGYDHFRVRWLKWFSLGLHFTYHLASFLNFESCMIRYTLNPWVRAKGIPNKSFQPWLGRKLISSHIQWGHASKTLPLWLHFLSSGIVRKQTFLHICF